MNCPICNVELRFGNTPVFGAGKLSEGYSICSDCYKRVIKIDHTIKLKKTTAEELRELFTNNVDKTASLFEKLKKIGIERDNVVQKKIIQKISDRIHDSESVLAYIEGIVWSKKLPCCLLLTDKRLYYSVDDVLNSSHFDIMLNKINSVSHNNGLLTCDLSIETSMTVYRVSTSLSRGPKFIDILRLQIEKENNMANGIPNNSNDYTEQIEKLFALKEKGIITESEFEKKKKELLGL